MFMHVYEASSGGRDDHRVRRTRATPLVLRPYSHADRAGVTELLRFLPALYPNGNSWLQRRLTDAEQGKALCTVAVSGNSERLAGLTIETPKGKASVKLSTIYVHPEYRSRGIGSLLLRRARNRWIHSDTTSAYVTVDESRRHLLAPLLQSNHFILGAVEPGRYAADRTEYVYVWDLNSEDLHYSNAVRTSK
jgi:GNAT superfamily N-acetyltransferase